MGFLDERNYVIQTLEVDACINCIHVDAFREEMSFDDEYVCGLSGEPVSIIGICDEYLNKEGA